MTTSTATTYFTPELFRFLRRLKKNNNREWFEKNRQKYIEQVRDPMLHFVAGFGPRLRRISRQFVADDRPQGGSMFRIYRDTRFARDKSPYKTNAGAHFRHVRAKDVHAPGFYLHLGTDGVFVGTGIWQPDGATLLKIRGSIVSNPAAWKRITRSKAFAAADDGGCIDTLRLSGESLKRPPRGFDPEHPLIEDLRRKDFVTTTDFDEADTCASDFMDRFTEVCRSSRPFMRFLTEAVDLAW